MHLFTNVVYWTDTDTMQFYNNEHLYNYMHAYWRYIDRNNIIIRLWGQYNQVNLKLIVERPFSVHISNFIPILV